MSSCLLNLPACFVSLGWLLIFAFEALSVQVVSGNNHTLLAAEQGSGALEVVYFERNIRPILKAHCFHCHGEQPELAGGLDLRLVHLMQSGGDSGAAISSGEPSNSLILDRIDSQEMPPGNKKLSEDDRQVIKRWIEMGAKTVRPEPQNPAEAKFTEEELAHWAFQPPVKPLLPATDAMRNSYDNSRTMDYFVAAELANSGTTFAPLASRAILLRRLKFDLHGLPPSTDELAQFLSDDSPDAYEKQVDRLLSSPYYGIRWARHWLDVVGYAESDGNVPKDQLRPHAWHYRDYVIDSFNDDKPYDQFLVEQLAGDELIDGAPSGNNHRHVELMAATGLLRMGPDVTQTDNTLMDRNQAVAEVLNVIGTGILGITVGCAQCHDHRYDPIAIQDYYRLRAVFDPAFPLNEWKRPSERLFDLTDDQTQAAADEIEKQAAAVQNDITSRKREHCQSIQEREIAKVPEELREAIRSAVNSKPQEQSEEQKQLLDRYPTVRTVDWIVGQLIEYDRKAYEGFVAEEKKVSELRATKPLQRLIMAVSEQGRDVPVSKVFFRGNPDTPTEEVYPSEIAALVSTRAAGSIPEVSEQLAQSTGRRLAYARQLTDGTHPTVARVWVNRVWQHHFGQGLVSTPGDFGLNGSVPSHPEILDWLAVDFMDHGWSTKWLHKQILLSRTYQQSALPENLRSIPLDAENRLLSRTSLRRLEAESLRDAILFVSGQLVSTMGGPSVPVTEDGEGKAVIGTQNRRNGLFDSVSGAGIEALRQSMYISTPRSLPLHELQTFDLPDMKPNCQKRNASTVAQQALFFMNDPFVIDASMRMSELLARQSSDIATQIEDAYLRLFSCAPTTHELSQCIEFLKLQTEALKANSDPDWKKVMEENSQAVSLTALSILCQSLLSSNRFLYVQ
ncbi:MAG: DUF1553 domain-containing protein [Planctomycetales bacterium]|nr:DUF1553 domain-containing protein [Planctomycetales bacterium]